MCWPHFFTIILLRCYLVGIGIEKILKTRHLGNKDSRQKTKLGIEKKERNSFTNSGSNSSFITILLVILFFIFSLLIFLISSDRCGLLPSILPTTLVRQVPTALCYCHLLPFSSWEGRRNAKEMQRSCATRETASFRATFCQFWWLRAKCRSNGQGGSDGHGKSFATSDQI